MKDINPDADIRVATVTPDGNVRVYGPLIHGYGSRPFERSLWFKNYGDAALWAAEFEQKNRDSRPVARR
jgi:hypothetical protein